jgi:tRNA/tmRNA/rRNA uracil-C5-methylase (TrmA/RlmC/RlmD family)
LPEQRSLKAGLLGEQLLHLAGVDLRVEVEELPGATDGLGWRSRLRYAADRDGRLGFRRQRSHDLEVVERCPLGNDDVAACGVGEHRWPGAHEVEVFAPTGATHAGATALVTIVPGRSGFRRRDLVDLGFADVGYLAEGEVLKGPSSCVVEVLGVEFTIGAGRFWQVHDAAAETLARAVLEAADARPGEHVLDLYAGVGLFSVLLAARVGVEGAVTAIERNRGACADARTNGASLPQLRVRRTEVTPALVGAFGAADLVVLDPPREGAGTAVMDALVSRQPQPRRIIYVACDAASLARDLRVALDARWRLVALRAFDLFPMTEHLEALAVLEPPED